MSATTDPDFSTIHRALILTYGSSIRRELNVLTASLRKMALAVSGLQFLLQCRRHHAVPRFASDAVRFAQQGDHLRRLAEKLPGRILRAAIRDSRQRLFQTQQTIDIYWIRLHKIIKDHRLWNAVVEQKDAMFYRAVCEASLRLR